VNARGQHVPKQGVGDVWTDPQFHTSYPTSDFGKGNLEQMGIDGFFKSHKCNSICEFLGIGKVCIHSALSVNVREGFVLISSHEFGNHRRIYSLHCRMPK
jgi:hypothetical protein